jgi:hypothetical protein
LLILDNHDNYIIFKFVIYIHDHKIVLFYLSIYSIHRLQSLDIGIFNLLAIYYDQFVKERNRYEGREIIKREYMQWILLTRSKTNSRKNIISAFTITGLVPFDPNRILR